MKIPPKYRITKNVSLLLSKLEANKEIINRLNIPPLVEENFRRKSILGSALFSARIEGNTLNAMQISSFRDLTSKDQRKVEVANLVRVITTVVKTTKPKRRFGEKDIILWQDRAMRNILSGAYRGDFRKVQEGLFDSQGNLINHFPAPNVVPELMENLLKYVNSKRERLVPIKAILSHLIFEKIHPFVDGNGRTGRILQLAMLNRDGYGMRGLVNVEEEIDKNRNAYYFAIEESNSLDATPFIETMLEFMITATDKAKKEILAKEKFTDLDLLPLRRKEIYGIIKDHPFSTLDFLQRRFLKIDPRLLRYDLKALADQGFIQKNGITRGASYSARG